MAIKNSTPTTVGDADGTLVYEERPSTRIREFLKTVRPLRGCNYGEDAYFQRGRQEIEDLAWAYATGMGRKWSLAQCADVLYFLSCIEPMGGKCYCNDRRISPACGLQAILEEIEDSVREAAHPKRKAA